MLSAAIASACPTCKDSLAHDPASANLVRGYAYSILFMLSMPAHPRRPLRLFLLGSPQSQGAASRFCRERPPWRSVAGDRIATSRNGTQAVPKVAPLPGDHATDRNPATSSAPREKSRLETPR